MKEGDKRKEGKDEGSKRNTKEERRERGLEWVPKDAHPQSILLWAWSWEGAGRRKLPSVLVPT